MAQSIFNGGIFTYKAHLVSELSLNDLLVALFVEVGSLDLVLQLLQLVGLTAKFLDFSPLALVLHLQSCHLSSKSLLHALDVERALAAGGETRHSRSLAHVLLAHAWVEGCLSERHDLVRN